MSSKPEKYYEFLTREEALSDAPLRTLDLPDKHKDPLLTAHRLIKPYVNILAVKHVWQGQLRIGQLVVHDVMRNRFKHMFDEMLDTGCEIEKVMPAVLFKDDEESMAAGNTMAWRIDYNGRPERGVLSKHALCALDVSPGENPQIDADGTYHPARANPTHPDYRAPYEPAVLANYPEMLRRFSSQYNVEHGSFWNNPNIEQETGYPDYYPGAPNDLHHWELRDSGKNGELCMENFPMPDGLVYVHAGKIMLAA